ncbi:aerolysin family beta-barrel pore-forming toxin [Vibrio coralliilyticus]|uniref:aerolysin family beta-barrel pore-forming toxin n=1 Tax=Vibrio coralliilyticus TaxID=190893 RepID=UPI0015609110|nr:aerolysin family beta-barrel pore-forming toxin [Vibrio coralliilyticus]NRF27998.1 aerolysin family beta-barrel pore-forming toxin [Vibrio coralliilyticus]NRF82111.1 aerolysin family beta-barrel pore-forming toxin [Vibrio coralliilyticus]
MKMKLNGITSVMILTVSISHPSSAQTYTPQIDADYIIYPQPGTTIDAAEIIVNTSYFYKPIYKLGHGLGFAWAGKKGYNTSVGYGTERVKTSSNSYHLSPRVLSGVNHNPQPDDRLEVDIENIKFWMNGEDLLLADAELISAEPKAYQKAVMYNCDPNHTDIADSLIRHTETTDWSKSNSHGVSAEVGIEQAFEIEANIPLIGGATSTTTFSASFGTDHSWTSTNGGSETINFQQSYSTEVPPRTKKVVELNYYKSKARIPYSNKQIMSYDLTFRGFLRESYNMSNGFPSDLDIDNYPLYNDWTGNAYRPSDLDTYEVFDFTFGLGTKSAQQDIYSQYVNDLAGINNSSPWNWSKYISSSVHSLGMECNYNECDTDLEVWYQYGNQPLAEVLRRWGVHEEGAFVVNTAGLFHIVSSEAIPMTADEIATQCSAGYQGTVVEEFD